MIYDYKEWCIQKHEECNHKYYGYIPYRFHLEMVYNVAKRFKGRIPGGLYPNHHEVWNYEDVVFRAVWGHDLIEDTRQSYKDVKDGLGTPAADIIYAVTNEKGKNRAERANARYYELIRGTHGAHFVKLCDRIANVEFSKMMNSPQFIMYQKENDEFCYHIGNYNTEMIEHLKSLFK